MKFRNIIRTVASYSPLVIIIALLARVPASTMFSRRTAQRAKDGPTNLEIITRSRQHPGVKYGLDNWTGPMGQYKPIRMLGHITQYPNPSPCSFGDTCVQCYQHFMDTNFVEAERRWSQNADFLAYETKVDNATAKSIVANLVVAMNEEHTSLVDKIANFGDRLLEQWERQSHPSRLNIIDKAFKGIPSLQFPQIRIRATLEDWMIARNHSTNWSMPWICHKVLVEKASLAQLLEVRSRYAPHEWIQLDLKNVQWARMNALEGQTFNAGSVIMYGYQRSQYKSDYSWSEGHRMDRLGFSVAKTLFEKEVALLKSLHAAVDEILGKRPKKTGNSLWKTRAESRFALAGGKRRTVMFSDLEGRFFAPPLKFDPAKILQLAEERKEHAETEMLLLQTSPSYLRDAVTSRLPLKYYRCMLDSETWQALAFDVWDATYQRLEAWDYVHDAAVRLEKITREHTRDGKVIEQGRPLPTILGRAMSHLERCLYYALHRCFQKILDDLIPLMGTFEDYYDYSRDTPPVPKESWVVSAKSLAAAHFWDFTGITDQIHWALVHLAKIAPTFDDGSGLLIQFAESLLREDPEKRDDRLSEIMSDLVSLNTIQVILDLSRPRHESNVYRPGSGDIMADLVGEPNLDLAYRNRPPMFRDVGVPQRLEDPPPKEPGVDGELQPPEHPSKARRLGPVQDRTNDIGNALKAFYEDGPLPPGKKDIEWLHKVQSSRALMGTFWAKVKGARRDRMQEQAPRLPLTTIMTCREINVLSQYYTPELRAQWNEEEREIKAGVYPTPSKKRRSPTTGQFAPSFPHGEEGPAKKYRPSTEQTTLGKPKPKKNESLLEGLQALPGLVESDEEEPELEVEEEPVDPLLGIRKVKPNDLLVFALLWRGESGEPKRSISGDDFCGAMQRAGCTIETPGGSNTVFTLVNDPVGGAFSRCGIHGEHATGEGAIPSGYLKSWGERITLRFGWKWRHFALETAEDREAARVAAEAAAAGN